MEVLHVILLGVVKYLWKDFINDLKEKDLPELEARWAAFDIQGLNVAPIQPNYMVVHSKSLVGKEFRLILQAAPFVLFPLITSEQRDIWWPLCMIGSMVFQTNIEDMETYLLELKQKIDLFLYHISKMNGRWANKPKFHHLLHLPESI